MSAVVRVPRIEDGVLGRVAHRLGNQCKAAGELEYERPTVVKIGGVSVDTAVPVALRLPTRRVSVLGPAPARPPKVVPKTPDDVSVLRRFEAEFGPGAKPSLTPVASKVAVPVPAAKVEVRKDPVIAPVVDIPPLVAPPVVVKVEAAPVPSRAKKLKFAAEMAARKARSASKKAAAEAFRAEQAAKKAARDAEAEVVRKAQAEVKAKAALEARRAGIKRRIRVLRGKVNDETVRRVRENFIIDALKEVTSLEGLKVLLTQVKRMDEFPPIEYFVTQCERRAKSK